MTQPSTVSADTDKIRAVILEFLQQRLQPKLDRLKEGEEEKRQKLVEAHQPENWIADAAHRVGQIQQVTHALKYTHPDAKGTSLSALGNPEADELLVATHSIAEYSLPDVVGNAAALDVYKFLRLDAAGKTLLSRAIENDPALQAAFSADDEKTKTWMNAFAGITQSKSGPASHKLAKQLYWPLEGNHYHLLAPLFPTSLAHNVWQTIRQDRFSDEAKAARAAKRTNQPHAHGYREYPNLVIQQYGGTKPQNISQLNSERHGENYLLPSCPPSWHSAPVRPPLGVETVFDRSFEYRPGVRRLIGILTRYLYDVRFRNNIHIRQKRAQLVASICDEFMLFSAELQELEGNWTEDERCRLNRDEMCWFNPHRAEMDKEFSADFTRGDWKEVICQRFANWLNARLLDPKKPLPFGEAAAAQWQAVLDKELSMIRMEVEFND